MVKARIAVFVSGGGTNLQALLDATDRGELPYAQIVLVISDQANVYAMERAANRGILALHVDKSNGLDAFEWRAMGLLREYQIDLIVLAGFLTIFSENFVRSYPQRILNVHPSLIPAFCGQGFYGLKVHEAALERGVCLSGATVHFVNEIADGGPILLQKAVEVKGDDTPKTLQKRVMEEAEWVLLPKAVHIVSKQIVESAT